MDNFGASIAQALADGYTFERELGGGGMSRTYLAREHALSRRVVVKVLSPELLQGLSVERFKREVLLAAQLQHPHVVPVLSAGDTDGMPWFTMPYVDGESLRRKLEEGPIGIGESIGILRDVAKALAYAHAHGVVHRDIKPDNVLLSSGSATVTDFGIAKAITASRTDGGNATLTQAGMAIGTPAYMAPEQAAGDPRLDHRADIYSFGAMAYEVLAGQQVFAGLAPARQLVAHLSETPRDVRELRPEVPPALAALVMQCLAKDPDQRPADGVTIARVLDTVTTSGSSSAASMALMGSRLPLGKALGIWAAVSGVVVLTAWSATEVIGLPDWALAGATGVMLAGLPAILGTWWVQRTARRIATLTPARTDTGSRAPVGTMATFALKASPHVSWTRTWRAGAATVGAFILLVAGFMVSRAMGIGPAASLMGKGAFGENETVVVADFRPPAGDTLLGVTLGEALRTDLGQSANLRVLSRAAIREILQRMLRPAESAVPFAVAREIATREGAKAVVDGEVVRLGASYVLSARLVSALDGAELATFRQTASGDNELIAAVGALSRDIREKVGESLKGIRSSTPVERVTTPSLAALRRYMEGVAAEEKGEVESAVQAYEAAIALDSGFAMAWRKLSVVVRNNFLGADRATRALTEAWKHRDRLSDTERAITEGSYYMFGPEPDAAKALAAYEQLLARDSTNRTALNNAGFIYQIVFRRYDKSSALFRLAQNQGSANPTGYLNLQSALLDLGRPPAALDSVEQEFRQRFPGNGLLWEAKTVALWAHGRLDSIEALSRGVKRTARTSRQELQSSVWLRAVTGLQGRSREYHELATESAMANARAANPGASAAEISAKAAMQIALESATHAIVFGGDEARAREFLRQATSKAAVDAVPGGDRNWQYLAFVAALVGDAESARIVEEGYRRDVMPVDMARSVWTPRMKASAAIAAGRWNEGLEDLARIATVQGVPYLEDAFLAGIAHDRAGRPDSAIVWYERAVSRKTSDRLAAAQFWPAIHRRLAELHDKQGNAAKAIEHYEWFADKWKNADPEQQATVRAVRERTVALKAKLTPG
jgi:tetratricopeptide (TPR) repeat protein/tRNA A-37 threonylcarbamoyl transferase component Bud32